MSIIYLNMKAFRIFFESQLDRLLAQDNFLGSRDPQKLLRELKSSSSLKKLQKNFQSVTQNPYKILKMLAIANILIMYSKDFFSFIEEHFIWKGGNDEWLRTKFIQPYFKFLIRSCTSKQMYIACRTLKIKKQDALQTLFYCINMLKLLFKVVEKMPFLGRYYKQKNQASVGMAMEIIALQAQKFYLAFQFLLEDILRQKQYYIRTVQDQAMMRGIFMDQLSTINEQMTKLFLDKYFSPLSKGINVKVFRPQEHGLDCDKIFRSIAINRESALRKSQRSSIQKALFPSSGKVNLVYYQQALSTPTNSLTSSQRSCSFRDTLTAKDFNSPCLLTLPDQKLMSTAHSKMYKSSHSNRSTTNTLQIKNSNI